MTEHWTHVNHPYDERFDLITIETVPRWKESELSGDEWRFSYVIRAWRKGQIIVESSYGRLDWALKGLQSTIYLQDGENFDHEALTRTETLCDQPGCTNEATVFYKRLTPYTLQGEELVDHHWRNEYRQFCEDHEVRGDCSLDDGDHNYQKIENPRKVNS